MAACFLSFSLAVVGVARADGVRPAGADGPTQIQTSLLVIDVDDIDGASQSFEANVYVETRWRDPGLAHVGPGEVSRSLNEVWHPRLMFLNQQRLWETFPEIVEIAPDGEVVHRRRVWGSFSQPLELQDFPFDRQTFEIRLIAVGYTPDEVALVPMPGHPSGLGSSLSVPDWTILGWTVGTAPYQNPLEPGGIPSFSIEFQGERVAAYYLWKIIAPLVFIVIMSFVVFWLSPEQEGTQIGVATTAMLTAIAYRFMVGESLPKVSYLTRLDVFILGSTILVFLTLLQAVFTAGLASGGRAELAFRVDRWCRRLFPLALVSLLLLAFIL